MKRILLVSFVLLALIGCGKQRECYICKAPIQEGECVVIANISPFDGIEGIDYGNMTMEDVACEDCQLKYIGTIFGHCDKCLRKIGDGQEYIGEDFDGVVCEECATELWGDNKEQHVVWTCESCNSSFGPETHKNITASYESGICDYCYTQIFG